jgi:hypothetical protein
MGVNDNLMVGLASLTSLRTSTHSTLATHPTHAYVRKPNNVGTKARKHIKYARRTYMARI